MKKLLVIFLLILFVGFGYCFYRYKTDRFFMRQSSVVVGHGHSMQPTMYADIHYKIFKVKPITGDVVYFRCSKSECLKWGDTFTTDGYFIKRLTAISDEGKLFFDGDNKENSFDSDYFGWLLPSEISDVWVIRLK